MHGRTPEGDEVWRLHLAFLDAALVGHMTYAPDEEACAQIEEFTTHHEAGLALVDILIFASPPLPRKLHDQAVQAALRVWVSHSDPE